MCSQRSEEFVVRAYNGGTKKATHKSTLPYWKRYLAVKESLPSRLLFLFSDCSLYLVSAVIFYAWFQGKGFVLPYAFILLFLFIVIIKKLREAKLKLFGNCCCRKHVDAGPSSFHPTNPASPGSSNLSLFFYRSVSNNNVSTFMVQY